MNGDSAEYEALVREQLTALGYNSAAIPDDVLREFLNDFEEKMQLEGDSAGDTQLSYPTALGADEARRAIRPSSAPVKGSPRRKPAAGGAKAKAKVAARKAAAATPFVAVAAPAAPALAPAAAATAAADAPASPMATSPTQADTVFAEADASVADFGVATHLGEDDFAKSLGMGLTRPSTAPVSAPKAARGGGGGTLRGGLQSASMLGLGLGSTSGFIHSASSIGNVRRNKSDPVSMHQQREAQWRSDAFLAGSPRRPLAKPPSVGDLGLSPAPATTVAAPRRRPNTYVVPTSKRRDALVWETRMRMRVNTNMAMKSKGSKTMVPNNFVPPTEKRRDGLRWNVRAEMAMGGH